MPPLRPLTPRIRPRLHLSSIRSSSKNTTPPDTEVDQASETSRGEHRPHSNSSGATSDTVGALIENSSGMHWEKLWLKGEKNDKKGEGTKGVGREQVEQKESNKAHEKGDSQHGGADDRDGGRMQLLKAEAEAKGDEEWERSMRRSMK